MLLLNPLYIDNSLCFSCAFTDFHNDVPPTQALRRYSEEWILKIEDITEFVHEQYKLVKKRKLEGLMVARERVYPVSDPRTAAQIELDHL